MPHPARRYLIIGATIVVAGAGVYALASLTPAATGDDTDCTPEGGLRCVDDAIHVCEGGKTRSAGACPGGCIDEQGIARCTAEDGTLLAPEGAICRTGMAVCAVDAPALLVCREGRLIVGAECPRGCVDQGEQASLFCLDEQDHIRFAAGFPCPDFRQENVRHACGADGQSLLRCEAGLLVPHDVTCATCAQRKAGDLTCLDAAGEHLDPATGEPLPLPEAAATAGSEVEGEQEPPSPAQE